MDLLYPILGVLAILVIFLSLVGRQNRDLLRVRAYREFFIRLVPLLASGILVAGLPLVMNLSTAQNAMTVMFVYLTGTAILSIILARSAALEERRAGAAFRREDYEQAAAIYEELLDRRPLPRYYSALAAARDVLGDHHAAFEAADRAVALDPKLGIAYYNRASAHAATGNRERAREDLERVFRTDSNRRLRRAAEQALKVLEKN